MAALASIVRVPYRRAMNRRRLRAADVGIAVV
jgi:hypothetical protein